MYKIIIVDDEEIVRNGIKKRLNWEALGFVVVGEASNGRDALEIAEKDWPDVILTDIRMPIMDGIELTKIVNEKMPHTKVVILTGHEEFEYAQKSIKLGVLDYILKPISAAELSAIMAKTKAILDEKINNDMEIEALKRQVMQSMPVLRDRFLNDLIFATLSDTEINEKKKYFGVDVYGSYFSVVLVEIDDYKLITERFTEEKKQMLKFSILNAVNEVTAKYNNATVFIARYDFITIIMGYKEESERIKSDINSFSEDIRKFIEKTLRLTVSVGVGNTYEGLNKLQNSFNEAISALEYKFFIGKNSTIFITDVQSDTNSIFNNYPVELEKQIFVNIKLGNKKEVTYLLDRLIGKIMEPKSVTWGNIQIVYNQLVTMALKMLQEMELSLAEVFDGNYNPYAEMLKYETVEGLKKWAREFMLRISDNIALKRNNRFKQVIDRTKEYIETNFTNPDISLSLTARHVNISDCYFSVIFKSETGETFQDYVIKVRLNKAKELLRSTDLRTYEIAYKVGYNDPHYFGVAFKKYIGVTPTEFRDIGSI